MQFSSVAQSCLTLCNPMNCSMLGLPVHHQLPEFIQTHVHRVGDAKKCSNYHTIALISHASKEVHKILQARLQQYVNQELSDVQARFRKGRGRRDQIANICWITEKAREFQKNIYFCFIDYAKAFDCVDHKLLKNFKRWEYHITLSVSWETCKWIKKQQL